MQVQIMEAMVKLYGANHYHTLDSISDLTQTYWGQERWGEAERLHVHVVKGTMRLFGADHPLTLASIGCLMRTYRFQGRFKEAELLEAGNIDLNRL